MELVKPKSAFSPIQSVGTNPFDSARWIEVKNVGKAKRYGWVGLIFP
jgi:hypothetical protein